jgi:hypothetical protein
VGWRLGSVVNLIASGGGVVGEGGGERGVGR